MHPSLLRSLACPECGSSQVLGGRLSCRGCGKVYRVDRGVPRLTAAGGRLEGVAASFSYEWRAQSEGAFEPGRVFGRTPEEEWLDFLRFMGLRAEDLVGATVLDAGCGPAGLTAAIGAAGAATVVGVDLSEGVDAAFERCRHLGNVDIVQANILALPFKPASFDYVWSLGAIHHTPDPRAAHAALASRVKPGGTLFVWVYSKRPNLFRAGRTVFDRLNLRGMRAPELHRAAGALAALTLVGIQAYRRLRSPRWLQPRGEWGRRALKPRTRGELELTWFDALAPEYASRHTEAEVEGWFGEAAFVEVVAYDDPNVAVRGRAPGAAPSASAGLLTR